MAETLGRLVLVAQEVVGLDQELEQEPLEPQTLEAAVVVDAELVAQVPQVVLEL